MHETDKTEVDTKGGMRLLMPKCRALARREQAAVKIMKGNSSNQQEQLLHEIKMMERCVSAHIVRFLGFSVLDAGLVLVMEYMPGGSLFHALGEGNEFQWYKRCASSQKLAGLVDRAADAFLINTGHGMSLLHQSWSSPGGMQPGLGQSFWRRAGQS